jgi:hypothetical protein
MPEPTETADPATSAAPGPSERSGQGSHRSAPGGPNRSAWLMVLPWAALTTAVLAPFVSSRNPGQSTVSSIGAVAGPALLVAAVCALVAWRSTSAWSWWLYPPIVVIPAVVLVVLTNEVPDRLENVPQDVGDQGNRSLVAPEQAGLWTLQTGAGPEAQEAELRERLLRADETLEPVYGQYRRSADDILVYNGINVPASTDLARELVGTPEDALQDYLDGTGIVDVVEVPAGELSGAMACGTIPRLGPYVDLLVCGWADSGGIGTATYRVDGINLESAAETTRDFRADVTVTD